MTTARNWRSLFEDMIPRSVNVTANLTGLLPFRLGRGLRQLVAHQPARTRRLLPSHPSPSSTTPPAYGGHGTIYIVEGVSPDAIANFL
jgi:hypothetical protein